ncbi:MAG: TIGR00266 family protein [Thermoprotei archaeon]|nr:MAG: TIGR00266 family protein [Thermoprotei archaeon]
MKWRVDFGPAYSLLKVYLEPGEDVTSEAGAMVMYKGNIEVKTHTGGGLLKGILRAVAGTESLFLNTYRAVSPSEIWFAPRVPGDISYIDLASGSWIIQDSGYLAHHGNVDISVAWRGLRGLLAEGQLLWLKVSGRGGVWINSYGALDRIVLNPGERAVVDNFHFVAMPANVRWEARTFGGLKSFIFGGEGIIFEVWGPATIYVQTRTLPLLADSLRRYIGAR